MANQIKTNCPRDCYDGCGIVVDAQDDGDFRILGDPDHPVSKGKLCPKCAVAYNGAWQDPNKRLVRPLKRIGKKGSAKFEAVEWEEALRDIAAKVNKNLEQHGKHSLLHTHYSGTLSLIAYLFPNRLFAHLGASEVDPDSICNAAGHVAWHYLFGNSVMGFDPRTIKDANCLLIWGANPSHSAPHAHDHWVPSCKGTTIVVDPVKTKTAAAADIHLQLNPGTDAVLAFALLNELKRLEAFDQAFIDSHTVGADEVANKIDSATLESASEITGVPAKLIAEAAAAYAHGPSLLWCGQGLQRQRYGGNIMRAVGLLPAFTGNVGKPGSGFYYLNYTPAFAGIDLDDLAGASLAHEDTVSISHMDFARRLLSPDEFKTLFVWNTNPLASAPEQSTLREAFAREDLFTVVIDCFETDTAGFADYVLPAANFLEFNDLTFSYFHLHMGAQTKIREPLGESLPNQEICRRLAKAMGLKEPLLYEDDETLINKMMSEIEPEFGNGMSFSDLQARGHFYLGDEPMRMHETLSFDTPSGKIEIASAAAEQDGLPRTPHLAHDGHTDGDPNMLRLLTPASQWRLNDSYANDDHLNERAGPAVIYLNPRDAKRLGIEDNQLVRVFNQSGEVTLTAKFDADILTNTALSHKGRWPSLSGDGHSVNAVHTAVKADMGDSTSVHSTRVSVSPC
ncbi:MAG: molybdopterin-containing oxidoreductase family protein [Gammaproteobacteria bacterium]